MATVLDFTVIARDRASKVFKDVGKSTDGTRTKMDKLKIAAGLAGAAVAAAALTIGRDAVKNASAAEQSLGATETVFGNFSKGVVATSQKAAKQFGLSANEYRENANIIGSLLKNQGVSQEQLAGKTGDLIKKGADLAAVFGGSTKDAVDALASAFKGEFDPIERYGISLKQSTINAEAMNQAHVTSVSAFNKLTPAAQAAAKQQATLAIINKQSASSQGQFAAQTSTTAERLQIAKAQYTNLTAALGTQLLPAMNLVLGAGSSLLTFFSNVPGPVKVLAVGVAGLTAALIVLGTVQKIATATTALFAEGTIGAAIATKVAAAGSKAWAAAQWLLNAALTANPIGLVVVGIALLVGGLVLAYKKSETFRNIVNGAFKAVGTAVAFMWNGVIKPVFKLWLNMWFTIVGAIIHGAAAAFGWVPGIGPKLKGAARKFDAFRDSVNRSLDGIKDKQVHVTVKYTNKGINLTAPSSVGRRALGGPVTAGMPYIVGERKAELFVPDQSGRIVPQVPTQRAFASSSPAQPVVVNVYALDQRGAGDAIKQAMQDWVRRNGKPFPVPTRG